MPRNCWHRGAPRQNRRARTGRDVWIAGNCRLLSTWVRLIGTRRGIGSHRRLLCPCRDCNSRSENQQRHACYAFHRHYIPPSPLMTPGYRFPVPVCDPALANWAEPSGQAQERRLTAFDSGPVQPPVEVERYRPCERNPAAPRPASHPERKPLSDRQFQ